MDFINATFKIGDHFAGYYIEQVFGKAEQRGNVNKFLGKKAHAFFFVPDSDSYHDYLVYTGSDNVNHSWNDNWSLK